MAVPTARAAGPSLAAVPVTGHPAPMLAPPFARPPGRPPGRPSASARSSRVPSIRRPLATACAVMLLGTTSSLAAEAAGFRRVEIPNAGGSPIDAGLWYPSDRPVPREANTPWGQALAIDAPVAGRELPLVVLSHGNGGWMGGHAGLALALADAGFVAVAPVHPSDNDGNEDDPPSRWLPERPRDLSRAIDHLTGEWDGAARIDPSRIGAFGFSAGAYAALALSGARFDPERLVAFCRTEPREHACRLGIGDEVAAALADGSLDARRFERLADARVRATVIAGPALGFAFDPGSLAALTVPLQLWSGALDDAVPVRTNASVLLAHLPAGTDDRTVGNAGHFAFLAPCRAGLEAARPELWKRLCTDAPSFDRAAFQRTWHADVTAFFAESLSAEPLAESSGTPLEEPAARPGAIGVRALESAASHRDGPLDVTLWYPADPGGTPELVGDNGVFEGAPARRDAPIAAGRHPLVLLSHGGGGNARQLGWIANRLAGAGFVVAAPNHPGSTTGDASALGVVALWHRPADLSAVLDSLLGDAPVAGHVDADRIGALGFSAGGYAALALVGARIDPDALAGFCDGDDAGTSDCAFLARDGVDLHELDLSPAGHDLSDQRVRSAVVVDPGVVGTLTAASLKTIDVPVTIANLGAPDAIPKAVLADGASRMIPGAGYATVADATHFSFLPECKPAGPAILAREGEPDALCDDAGGRIRSELHREIGAMVVEAFERDLDER